MMGEGGKTAVVGQGVDKDDVPVSKPVDAEYDEVMASSTDGLPFRKSLRRGDGVVQSEFSGIPNQNVQEVYSKL